MLLVTLIVTAREGVCGYKQPEQPDYTKGEALKQDRYNTNFNRWNLGPTGVIVELWAHQDMTARTRQMRILEIFKGSPAEGVLKPGDVILGLGKERFSSDPRKAMAQAITEAETKKGGGDLVLLIWRPDPDAELSPDELPTTGKEMSVTVKLPVLGSYSETTPWNCEKTEKLIDSACAPIVKRGLFRESKEHGQVPYQNIPSVLDALGLLSTGEAKYLPVVRKYARAMAPADLDLDVEGLSSWYSSYTLIFLSEYYLATKDEAVLPAIKEYANTIAMGRSGVGTWSHGMAKPSWNGGKFYGKASAYGSMNAVGLTLTIALQLAEECGVKNAETQTALRLSKNFFRWFVDKGAIPYGDHKAGSNHDNNGANTQAAVLFDLVGEAVPTAYFNRTGLASYTIRELGHTGHYFGWQWGALGSARGGPKAAQSFIDNTRWFVELERRFDGSFVYQPQLAGKDHGKYTGWSTTGSRLMQMCLPRQALRITGKGRHTLEPLTGDEIRAAEAAGVYAPGEDYPTARLLEDLGSSWPVVREAAAKALGQRDENVVDKLITMLKSENRYARYGACEGLYYAGRGSPEAVKALVDTMQNSEDITLRRNAVYALKLPKVERHNKDEWRNALGEASRAATPALLKMAATDDPENDPGRKLQCAISDILFYWGNVQNYRGYFRKNQNLEGVDRKLLLAALKSLLTNPNGRARSWSARLYPVLTEEEVKELWPDIYRSTSNEAPSGVMMSNGDRFAGLRLMAEHHIKEGIPLAIDIGLRQRGWGSGGRLKNGVPPLLAYGGALKEYLPEINEVLQEWGTPGHKRSKEQAEEFLAKLDEALKQPAPKLVSITQYIKEEM